MAYVWYDKNTFEYSDILAGPATQIANELTDDAGIERTNYTLIVGRVQRGWTDKENNRIIIPEFAFAREYVDDGYVKYYVSHELTHTLIDIDGHGPEFQEKFKEITPDHLEKYEQQYRETEGYNE